MHDKMLKRCHTIPKTGIDGDPHFATRIISRSSAVGKSAFSGCGSLTSITLPSGITALGDSAFHGYSSPTSIDLPTNLIGFAINAFYGCSLRGINDTPTTRNLSIATTNHIVNFKESPVKAGFIMGNLDDLL